MSIRKRTWTTRKGEQKEAWICDYTDQHGERHIQTFQRKKDADAWSANTKIEVRHGTHTADSKSVTVREAGDLWIASAERNGLERATIALYRQHLAQHIVPYIGATKLSQLSAPMVRAFEDKLSHSSSPAMVRPAIIRKAKWRLLSNCSSGVWSQIPLEGPLPERVSAALSLFERTKFHSDSTLEA